MFTGDYGFFDYKYDIPGYHGQDFGGPAQLFYLALSALLTVLLLRSLRGLSRERLRRLVGWTGVFLILLYLGKTAWETYYDLQRSGSFNWGLLPLDTCSLVMPAALLAGFGRGRARRLGECWLVTGGVAGGLATMVSLNALNYYPFLSFGGFYSMLWHFLMVLLGLLLGRAGLWEEKQTPAWGFRLQLLAALAVIPVDFLFDFDFMMYRQLGGIPLFEDLASDLSARGLGFLNPLLMLGLYWLAFRLVSGLPRLLLSLRRSGKPGAARPRPV